VGTPHQFDCPNYLGIKPISDEEVWASKLLQSTTGLDITSEHGRETPKRFVAMLKDLTTPNPKDFDFTVFDNTEQIDEMVIMTNIPYASLCNHHVVPYFGFAHVAYIPQDKIVGISKLGRIVRYHSRGLSVQEHLTAAIADSIEEKLKPRGVAVMLTGEHMCMALRGAQMPGTKTTTTSVTGVFADHARTAKQEFLSAVDRAR